MRDDELRDLRPLRPDSYVTRSPLWSSPELVAFQVREPGDFDWMERMILTHGYYEHEGVWDLALGFDKQARGEIMAAFRPRRTLEIGCATGTVLHYLAGLGVPCKGVEISRMAVERALPDVRDRIHQGDLLTLPLTGPFDLVYGLDVFDLPWVPKLVVDGSEDTRELGIGLEDVELRNAPDEEAPRRTRSRWAGALDRLRARGRPRAGR